MPSGRKQCLHGPGYRGGAHMFPSHLVCTLSGQRAPRQQQLRGDAQAGQAPQEVGCTHVGACMGGVSRAGAGAGEQRRKCQHANMQVAAPSHGITNAH